MIFSSLEGVTLKDSDFKELDSELLSNNSITTFDKLKPLMNEIQSKINYSKLKGVDKIDSSLKLIR